MAWTDELQLERNSEELTLDPNETLRELRELAHDGAGPIDMAEADRMAELFHALDNWLRRGGFPPDDWRYGVTSVIPEREAEARKVADAPEVFDVTGHPGDPLRS